MRRREFLAGLLLATAPWRVQAQQVERAVRLGYLAPAIIPNLLDAFRNGLRDLGYVEGRNLSIEFRFAEGRPERLDALATELVQLAPDVIVTVGTTATLVAKRATGTLPIVAAPAGDPIRRGVVVSLAQPGGNVTGVTLYASELSQKRLEVLREAVPAIKRVAVLGNASNINHPALWDDTEAAGRKLGLELRHVMAKGLSDLEPAFAAMTRDGVDALLLLLDAEFDSGREQIVRLASEHLLPAMYDNRA
jgi:putative ABC transport system substrate-binding protein